MRKDGVKVNMNKGDLYLVTKQHRSNYPNPIALEKGQTVNVGEAYTGEEGWDNWRYCYTLDKRLEGWVPEQIIIRQGNQGIISENYIAKELNVNIGDRVIKRKDLNGWFWVEHIDTTEEGWVPKNNLKRVKE